MQKIKKQKKHKKIGKNFFKKDKIGAKEKKTEKSFGAKPKVRWKWPKIGKN